MTLGRPEFPLWIRPRGGGGAHQEVIPVDHPPSIMARAVEIDKKKRKTQRASSGEATFNVLARSSVAYGTEV